MYKLLALFFILILLAGPALAGTATITIFGTNASNAQANLTNTGNQSVNVTAWNVGGVKTFRVNVTNASDTLTFNLYNVTAGQVNEFRVNNTAINGYQADSSGLVTFTRTQGTGNSTFNLAPAVQQGGYNATWAYIQNLVVQTATTIYNVAIYNATQVQGNGSGLTNLNRSNVTGQTGVDDAQNVTEAALQANDTYFNGTVFPNSTNFRNDSAVQTSTYSGNFPNSTVASKEATWDAKEPAISQGVSPQFWMFNKTWQNITTTWVTEGVNLWFTDARAISAVQSILDAINQSSAANNTASQGRDDAINGTKVNKTDLNSTVQISRSQVTGQEGVDTAQNVSITNIESVNVNQNTSITNLGLVNDAQNASNVNQDTNLTNQAAYDNSTFGTKTWINTTNQAQDTNLTNFQGYVNNTALPAKADATHTNATLNEKVNKSGDTMTGVLVVSWVNDTAGNAYLKNVSILNTSTVTVGRNTNGTIQLTSSAAGGGNASYPLNLTNATRSYLNVSGNITLVGGEAVVLERALGDGSVYSTTVNATSTTVNGSTDVLIGNYALPAGSTSVNVTVYMGANYGRTVYANESINNGSHFPIGSMAGGLPIRMTKFSGLFLNNESDYVQIYANDNNNSVQPNTTVYNYTGITTGGVTDILAGNYALPIGSTSVNITINMVGNNGQLVYGNGSINNGSHFPIGKFQGGSFAMATNISALTLNNASDYVQVYGNAAGGGWTFTISNQTITSSVVNSSTITNQTIIAANVSYNRYVSLSNASNATNRTIIVKNTDSVNTSYIIGDNGTSNTTLLPLSSYQFYSDGTQYYIIGQYMPTTIISNTNATTTRVFDTQYKNDNNQSMMLFITANITTTVAGGNANMKCKSDIASPPATNISGNIGINAGLLNENVAMQLTCIVAPHMNYTVNTSTTNGVIELSDWREVLI